MKDIKTLIDAATLKGYLIATDAPREIASIAEGLVERLSARMLSPLFDRLANEDAKLPTSPDQSHASLSPTDWFSEDRTQDAPRTFDYPMGAPEANHAKLRSTPPANEAGKAFQELSVVKGAAPDATPRKRGGKLKLEFSMLSEIQAALQHKSFGVVGHEHGVSGETVKNFLRRHGIDTAQYRKAVGKPKEAPSDDDSWPETFKPELTPASEKTTASSDSDRMQFKSVTTTVRRKGRWGEYDYPTTEVVAQPQSTYKDAETGVEVTKYPPGYARGAYPQRNVSVKGGS